MNKWLKRGLIGLGILGGLLALAVFLIPSLVDVEKYRPQIEQKASEALNRPVHLTGALQLSVFPWAGVTVSDFSVDNPEGFQEAEFVSVKSFDVRVKLLPLLSKDIQVSRFVLKEPRIILERTKDGKANWEGLGPAGADGDKETETDAPETDASESGGALPVQALVVNDLSIINGRFVFDDRRTGQRREISELNLNLKNISFDRPVDIDFSAMIDGKPFRLAGSAGPVGRDIGKGTIPLDLALRALDQMELKLSGTVTDPAGDPRADLAVSLASFSPRKVMDTLGMPFPVETADPETFQELALEIQVKGGKQSLEAVSGHASLDGSRLTFSIGPLQTDPPELRFDFDLDALDVKRYLPPQEKSDGKGDGSASTRKQTDKQKPSKSSGTDGNMGLALLDKAVIEGKGRIGSLKIPGAELEDILLSITGRKGAFRTSLSARRNGLPLAVKTAFGPVKNENLPLTADVRAFNEFRMDLSGTLLHFRKNPAITASVQAEPFSPRKLTEILGQKFPMQTADPSVLNHVAFQGDVKAGAGHFSVSRWKMTLDDTDINMSVHAEGLDAGPNIRFDAVLSALDLDRYLPPKPSPEDGDGTVENNEAEKNPQEKTAKKSPDYSFLRQLTLDGKTRMKELKAGNARLRNIRMRVTGRKGVFRLDPLAADLYEGKMNIAGSADFRKDAPETRFTLKTSGIQIHPLLKEVLNKDILEGKTDAEMTLSMKGDTPEAVKRNLSGNGFMRFSDGVLRGVDLAGMVRNAETAYALFTGGDTSDVSSGEETPFTELNAQFTITDGRVRVPQMRLTSPVLQAESAGEADLNTETLDFGITPKFVSGLGGKRVSLMVPVLVSGTFDKPVFRPDVAGVIRMVPKETVAEIIKDPKKGIKTLTNDLKDIFIQKEDGTGNQAASEPESEKKPPQNGDPKKDGEKKVPIEKQIGDILKKIPFGQ